MKIETILESHGKGMDFCLFQEAMENLFFREKVLEKSWKLAETVSSVHDIWLWHSSSLHLQVHYFLSGSLVHVQYYNISVCMEVAGRGGHLYFSKKFKFMVKVYFPLRRPYS